MARQIPAIGRAAAAEAARARVPDIIARIKDGYAGLRPAEQAVANTVLGDVQAAVSASNGEIARRAGVSQPTVTRFCRAIGCEGVRDFKLQLARSLVVGDLYLHPAASLPAIPAPGQRPPFWTSVLAEAHAALAAVDAQLDFDRLESAAGHLTGARVAVVFGLGGSSAALAEEAAHRLFRYGLAITPLRDPYLARMTAATLRPDDVLILISATGRTPEVIEAAETARQYGATTMAITTPDSALARAVDIALTCAVPEVPDTLTPSASRFAMLAIIDLLAAATGYRLGPAAHETLRRVKYAFLARRPGDPLDPLGD